MANDAVEQAIRNHDENVRAINSLREENAKLRAAVKLMLEAGLADESARLWLAKVSRYPNL